MPTVAPLERWESVEGPLMAPRGSACDTRDHMAHPPKVFGDETSFVFSRAGPLTTTRPLTKLMTNLAIAEIS